MYITGASKKLVGDVVQTERHSSNTVNYNHKMSVLRCKLVYGDKKYSTRLKSSDLNENYQALINFCDKKTKKEYGKDVYIEVDGIPIGSKETFASVVQKKIGQSEINMTIKVRLDLAFVLFFFVCWCSISYCTICFVMYDVIFVGWCNTKRTKWCQVLHFIQFENIGMVL